MGGSKRREGHDDGAIDDAAVHQLFDLAKEHGEIVRDHDLGLAIFRLKCQLLQSI